MPVEVTLDVAIHHEEIVVTGAGEARRLEEFYQPADVVDSTDLQAKRSHAEVPPRRRRTAAQLPR